MYAEWASLTEAVRSAPCSEPVLSVFSPEAGREVVRAVLTSLATAEPPTDDADSQSTLSTPEQIRWTMQVRAGPLLTLLCGWGILRMSGNI